MKQGRSGLSIRELKSYVKTSIPLKTKNLTQWIKVLPTANLGKSARSVYSLLVEMNHSALTSELRFSILGLMEPIVYNLSETLEKKYLGKHIALSEQQKKVSALIQAIRSEILWGYHATIESLLIDESKENKYRLMISIATAIEYHGLLMLHCYQLYALIPTRLWRDMYQLYTLAQENMIEMIDFKSTKKNELVTINHYFIHILLMSVATPYQLRKKEMIVLWELLFKYTGVVFLDKNKDSFGRFVVNLNSSSPPLLQSLYQSKTNENYLKLSISLLISKLNKRMESILTNNKNELLIIHYLMDQWQKKSQRNFVRSRCQESSKITIGLAATHYCLTENEIQEQKKINFFWKDSLDLENATLIKMTQSEDMNSHFYGKYLNSPLTPHDIWDKAFKTDQDNQQEIYEKNIKSRSQEAIVREAYRVKSCELVNISAGGYCIQLDEDELPKNAQAGEIVGFIDNHFNPNALRWSIGVVCWVRCQRKKKIVQMGIKLLAPEARSVKVQLKSAKNKEQNFQRSLLLPEIKGLGIPVTIITNSLSFNVNTKVCIAEKDHHFFATFTKELTSSPGFRRFSFEKVSSEVKKKEIKELMFEDDFWDLI
jgi:hypothetical protein